MKESINRVPVILILGPNVTGKDNRQIKNRIDINKDKMDKG